MTGAFFSLLLFLGTLAFLLIGFPVAFALAGSAFIFAGIGYFFHAFDTAFLAALPERIYGTMTNETLLAVPLFVFMGVVLERSKISESLLNTMTKLFGGLRGGMGLSVCFVGGLLAASTGIVGATVVTMGLISLPSMLKKNYDPSLSCGLICASGTLGQIIPPSIVLIILADVMGTANQQAQLALGNWSPSAVSVGDLFAGALIPGLLLVLLYCLYVLGVAWLFPKKAPALNKQEQENILSFNFLKQVVSVLIPPFVLIFCVLGSIFFGFATPTEAASVGSMGALALAVIHKKMNFQIFKSILITTTHVNSMVFMILIGASVFSLVFRGFGGDQLVEMYLKNIGQDSPVHAFVLVMAVMFFMGFFLDFFEITFVVVPLVGPPLIQLGLDPIWLGVMMALNLQTSFLTPPFGFSLFYLRSVTPASISTSQIYRGVIPFILIQIMLMVFLWFYPQLIH